MNQIHHEIQLLTAYLHAIRATLRADPGSSRRSERGAVTPETVILTAVFAAGAIAIGTIIVTKFTGAANNIPTGP